MAELAPDDLVTVVTFPDVAEAELARERLELEGVTAVVMGAQSGGVMPYLAGSEGVRVQVQRQDVDRAREILGT
ncbi:MAG TPA: DUF2007 domain-containing protein [Polyangiaceae bacterium]